ncbi:hypothetical protein CK203_036579 [Vitis vinifera]|uniref:Metallo-beta-lactamase domain-containing protein n=1 Tax=Vitis vinifera TaxID=29760 RepID=A0A438I000_VITVI|nr:hypothetical protein CK203_036579 [Vitis vinifera]
MLGLKINLEKSKMIPVREMDNVEDLACEIGCKVGKLSSSYLGFPLGASYESVAVWDGVEERFHKKLSLWKRQHLSKGEDSLYFAIPLLIYQYILSLCSTSQELPFFANGVDASLVKEIHCGKKSYRESFGRKKGVGSQEWSKSPIGLGFEKRLGSNGIFLIQRFPLRWVGNGVRVKFWKDRWCSEQPLCEIFPSLFALYDLKEAWIILTHEHADAVLGLDDMRAVQPFSPTNDISPTPVYLSQYAMESIATKFPYLVKKKLKEGQELRRVAQLDWKIIESNHEKPFVASGLQFVPLPVMHGEDYLCLGFLFGEKCKVAYISDISRFPSSTEYGEY